MFLVSWFLGFEFDRDTGLSNIKRPLERRFERYMNGYRVPIATYGGSLRDETLKNMHWAVYQPHLQISIKNEDCASEYDCARIIVKLRLFMYPVSYKYNNIDYLSDVHTAVGNVAFRLANDIEKCGIGGLGLDPGQLQINTRAYVELPLLSAQQRCVEKSIAVNSPVLVQKKLLNLLRSSNLSTRLHPMLVNPGLNVQTNKVME
jgi:hypothetical protein